MRKARFRVELPQSAWIGEVSRAHPEAVFRMLSGLERQTSAVELGEILADPVSPATETLRSHPSVEGYDLLYEDRGRVLARYEVTDLSLYRFLQSAGVPPEFPLVAGEGSFEIDVTASPSRLREIEEGLDALALDHEVLFVVEREASQTLLTDRQQDVLETAYREGYFEVPRDADLGDLAQQLDVDESTVSGVLRRAEEKVLGRFLADPTRRIDR